MNQGNMSKKIFLLAGMLIVAMNTYAQIGYKGQVAFDLSGGISNVGSFIGAARLSGYLSEHSVLGVGLIYDNTRYDATKGDTFHVAQWLGELHYQYAIPLNRFIFLPSGGLMLGGERADRLSKFGNILPYDNQFVYGMMLECNIEYVFGRHWAVALEPRMIYLIKTHFDNIKLSLGVGLKYYF